MRRSYVVPMRWMVVYEYEVPGGALNLISTKLHGPWSPWESSPSRKYPHGRTGNRTRDLMISSQTTRMVTLLKIKCVFIFSLQLLSEIFLIVKSTERHIRTFNRNLFDTRWQQYSTQLHTNNTQSNTSNTHNRHTIHRITQTIHRIFQYKNNEQYNTHKKNSTTW
jgi:hypothetical protein